MAGKSGIINVKFIADVDKMNKGIAQVNTQLTGFAKVAKYAGIAAAAAFAAKPIVDGIGQSIKAAADLQEAANKVSVVFGTAGNDVLRWAENSVTAFGQSEASALEAAGTFGNLLRSFGETEQKAAEMSTTLVQLSADLASLNNVDIRTVTDSIRSGLSGEQEPLKRLGVTLSDVRLRAEAAALGLKTTGAALDPLVKAQASYSLIMKDTALAQGDFSRTQDSLVNTTRTLQAAIDDAKASIGEGFVIALEEATAAAGGAQGLAGAIEDAGYETGLLIRSLGTAAGALDKLRGKTEDAEEATKDFSDGWLQWIARCHTRKLGWRGTSHAELQEPTSMRCRCSRTGPGCRAQRRGAPMRWRPACRLPHTHSRCPRGLQSPCSSVQRRCRSRGRTARRAVGRRHGSPRSPTRAAGAAAGPLRAPLPARRRT